jgi:AbrB family looped-hinge helix DNA binding protein
MRIAQSKVTAQGRISVPAEVLRRLGIGPGSVLVWEERDGEFVVRRAGRCTSEDVHAALFEGKSVREPTRADVKEGTRKYVRRRHARR